MAGRTLVPLGRLQVASDLSVELLVSNATRSRDAVDERVRAIAPGVLAANGAVLTAAVAAVNAAVAGMQTVQVANSSDIASTMSWTATEVAAPYSAAYSANYNFVSGQVAKTAQVPRIIGGKIDKSLIPPLDYAGDLDIPALVSAALADGRPSWMPGKRAFDARLGTWNLRPDNMKGWKVAQARMKAGLSPASVLVVGDSLAHLGGPPWNTGSWPGRMRRELIKEYGDGGSGIANLWNLIPLTSHTAASSSEDNRWTYVNAATGASSLTAHAGGTFRASMVKITDSGSRDSYLEFTNAGEAFDELWLYGLVTATRSAVLADGVEMSWAKDVDDNTGADIKVLAGYASGQRISKLTLPKGAHTIRIYGTVSGVIMGGAEGRITGPNLIVHNSSKSSATLNALGVSSGAPESGVDSYGWTLDLLKPNLVIIPLIINDWQGHRPLDLFIADALAAAARVQANGASVIWSLSPQPDYALYPPSGGNVPAYTDFLKSIYTVANAADIPVIDNAYIWRDYATMADLFSDGLHHVNLGREYMALSHAAVLKE